MEIELQPPPKPITIIPDSCLWVALYFINGSTLPMCQYGRDKADVMKWAVENTYRDPDKPIKLYRLDY
jgi:hypothetical protein